MKDINEVLKDDRVRIIWRNVQNDKAIQVKIDLQPKGYEKFSFLDIIVFLDSMLTLSFCIIVVLSFLLFGFFVRKKERM